MRITQKELMKLPTAEIDQMIIEDTLEINRLMNGFSTTIGDLKTGSRGQKEAAAELANTVRCVLCSLSKMSMIDDEHGLMAVRKCAAMHSGCKEMVQSN